MEFWLHVFTGLQGRGDFTGSFLGKQLILFCSLTKIQVNVSLAIFYIFNDKELMTKLASDFIIFVVYDMSLQ